MQITIGENKNKTYLQYVLSVRHKLFTRVN